MRAVVYQGPGEKTLTDVPDPKISHDGDAIVRIDSVTICGTDLHILKGDVPEVRPGTVLGHEAVGTVVETGLAVHAFKEGDNVLVSCISSCGRCAYCRRGDYGQCTGGGGWILGHTIDGVQAEYARIPFADTSLYRIPSGLRDDQMVYLADILPTAFEVGVRNGAVAPGDVVAIVGAGPIGLAAILTAKLYTPARIVAVEPTQSRRDVAVAFGADAAVSPEQAADLVSSMTGGRGADVVIEAVGVPATFELCTELVRAGGHVANVGVHGAPVTLHLEKLWIKNVTITTGLVNTSTIPTLISLIEAGRIDPDRFTTHRFPLSDAMEAYDTFSRAGTTGALKVLMRTS